jgi:N4-gp56 family major capsid protein
MAIQNYNTVASRNLIRAEFDMLKKVDAIQVLTKFGEQKEQPLKKTDTVVFRRLKPFNATANEVPNITAANFITAEGTTPTSNTISYTDVTCVVQQYSILFKYSSKSELMYEDNIPDDMVKLTADTLNEIAELVAYGQAKAGSSVIYGNGSLRTSVNTRISLPRLQQAARSMNSNRATMVTEAIMPGEKFNTSAVEPAYIVFCHTDAVSDVRALPGFVRRVEYGSAVTPVHQREFGACEDFRFVSSPLFAAYLAGGSGTLNGMLSAGGANVDVYPFIIIAENALGHVSLKGHGWTGIRPKIIRASDINHANPSGMFGYVGADFWGNTVRLNENFMTRIECGVTDLALT